jgi:Flp pilus assembly protein TadB
MLFDTVGSVELLRLASTMALLAAFGLFGLWVGPNLLARWRYRQDRRLAQSALAQEHRPDQVKSGRLLLVTACATLLVLAIKLLAGYNWFISILMGFALANLMLPLLFQAQDKVRQKKGRVEAMAIADYVAGRLNARATLFRALEDCYREHTQGRRNLALSAEGLEKVVQAVQVGQDLADQLDLLGGQFTDVPELAGLWRNLAILQRAHLGPEASVEQAEDLATSLRQMDALKDGLETELATSTMTRMAMFLLMGGFTAFLILAYGDAIGNVLINTLAGNIILGFSIFTLYLAQIVGRHIEKMPLMRF